MNAQMVAVGILPSLGALAIFFFVVRGIIRADRNEREQVAREEERIDAQLAAAADEEETPTK